MPDTMLPHLSLLLWIIVCRLLLHLTLSLTSPAIDNAWLPVYSLLWPEAASTELRISFMRDVVHYPVLYHVYTVGATALSLSKAGDSDSNAIQSLRQTHVEHYQKTIRFLNHELQKPTFQPEEYHIHAICGLARHTKPLQGSDQIVALALEPYPLSPMAWLQNIWPMSILDLVVPHVEAMYTMVSMRGGLAYIARPLQDILQM
jgi:hypothetical protein